ncbi:MAG: S-formylglutathione hydrolase [Cellvibrionales bacterium]|jgi:S-formylglutathione hydrolase
MFEMIDSHRSHGGEQQRYRHRSETLGCNMVYSVFLPPQATGGPVPVLYYLSGLTCTDENFVAKAGAQQHAARHGIAIVAPDTSPRGDDVPDDPDGAWDFGSGAGFYVNATQAPWDQHYRMYDYVLEELPALINESMPVDGDRQAITGHSMGGHGALTVGLRNPDRYRSISAFSPICSPSQCPWGHKALGRYLGDDQAQWLAHDACHLIGQASRQLPILVDQGGSDGFLVDQLKPELLMAAATEAGYPINLRLQAGYDHSYFFVSSFMADHMAFHAQYLSH